jgi:hypothetical protein
LRKKCPQCYGVAASSRTTPRLDTLAIRGAADSLPPIRTWRTA